MRIAAINGVQGSSTGQIMNDLATYAWMNNHEMYTFVPAHPSVLDSIPWSRTIGTAESHQEHIAQGIRTGLNGCYEVEGTKILLRQFEDLGIDLIHLFNLHNFVLNLPLLFQWAKKNRVPIVWTLHCSWAYTGKCIHYSMIDCNRWKTGCYDCPLLDRWPYSDIDTSSLMWRLKKRWFSGVDKMVVVGIASWLTADAQQSLLGQYPVRLIYNGINLNTFHPIESDFRIIHHLEEKTILLGVADNWLRRKGLQYMISLASKLDSHYQLVLVGTNEQVEKMLPPTILPIRHTTSKTRLAQIYTAADIFLQTTQEETFGLVNVEALACGTPVITFDVGGCADAVDESCGRIVPPGDIDAMLTAIEEQRVTHSMTSEACLQRAAFFDVDRMCNEYFDLYHELIQD